MSKTTNLLNTISNEAYNAVYAAQQGDSFTYQRSREVVLALMAQLPTELRRALEEVHNPVNGMEAIADLASDLADERQNPIKYVVKEAVQIVCITLLVLIGSFYSLSSQAATMTDQQARQVQCSMIAKAAGKTAIGESLRDIVSNGITAGAISDSDAVYQAGYANGLIDAGKFLQDGTTITEQQSAQILFPIMCDLTKLLGE